MFSRVSVAAAVGALGLLTLPASAQVEADAMGDISAWGQRFLEPGEAEFSLDLWQGSDDEMLLVLLQSIEPSALGPAERRLLRRLLLSPATPPEGDGAEDLLLERALLLLDLGETEAAAALARDLDPELSGLDAEALEADLELSRGREASACSRLDGPLATRSYGLQLRAVCAMLRENYAEAQLAIEVADLQDAASPWLVSAVFAASGDLPEMPPARMDRGLYTALSLKAGFEPSEESLEVTSAGQASLILSRPSLPQDLRETLLERAAIAGMMPVEVWRESLLIELMDIGRAPQNNLEETLFALNDPLVTDEVRAEQLAALLESYEAAGFVTRQKISELFIEDLAAQPFIPSSGAYAHTFATSALLAGDAALARDWLAYRDDQDESAQDPFATAWLEASSVLLGSEEAAETLPEIEARLVAAVETSAQERRAADMLTLWTALDLPLSANGRAFVASLTDEGERLAQGQVTALNAALLSGAQGEAVLSLLTMIRGDAARLASNDLAALLSILRELGAGDIARDLAFEIAMAKE